MVVCRNVICQHFILATGSVDTNVAESCPNILSKKKKLNLVLCPLTCPETVLTSCWKYHVNTISSSWHELQLIYTESLISMYETYKSNRFLVCSNIQCQCFIQLGFFLFFLDANQIVFENCKDENSYQGKLMLNWHFIKK